MKWLAQYATRVAVRRVVTILVLALLAWAGIGRAEAACTWSDSLNAACTDIGSASAAAASIEAAVPGHYGDQSKCLNVSMQTRTEHHPQFWAGGARFVVEYKCGTHPWSNAGTATYPRNSQCPAGSVWDEVKLSCVVDCGTDGWADPTNPGQCLNREKCLAKPVAKGVRSPGMSGTICNGGCQFQPQGLGMTAAFGGGEPMTVAPDGWSASGEACTAGDPAPDPIPEQGACTPLGSNQTACMQEDGKHCHITPSGKRFCWQPGEVGEKTDGPDLQRTDPGETPQTPNPPESGDQLIPEGQPVTTEITQNGRKSTTTTTSYSTQHGTNAGTGPGQAEGGGTGSGGGNGDGDGDGEDGGGVGDGVGTLYEGSGKTLDDVIGGFVTNMSQAGIIAAAGNFMGNCSFAGNCPVWTWDGGDYAGTMTFDQLCSGALSGLLQYGGWIVLALGAFAAFRIAVY